MKICIVLAIVACATAFVLPASSDIQSLINDAHKALQESDLSDSVKLELTNLLSDPQFVEQLIANNMDSFSSTMRSESADPAERCLFLLALLLAQLAQALVTATTTVATTTTTAAAAG
uniref:Uncharacterized protein n=1 Tax=Daphnia galeata TaxID=27404 RepID=A0A8J2RXT0_9CRUS|nr:unnamed protein product [Daphnia galeata]